MPWQTFKGRTHHDTERWFSDAWSLVETGRRREAGAASSDMVYATAMPLLIVLAALSLLVATLSTVGIFLRLRTASLTEIQLRLSALEEMLAAGAGGR